MMTGGIDSLLNNRVAAGRQDPQYLTNSYQKNQDLLDLLALQKLKSEKEAAKRQMLLQGGGTPPTVREQREQELVSMNKQELAQQVGGAAQQQMAQQQQAMQRMMSGVGGQQVPTMMAEGGIVGYQEGGYTIPPEMMPRARPEAAILEQYQNGEDDNQDPSALQRVGGDLLEWAKANPADAASLGLMLIPGVGWVGAGLRGLSLAAKGLGGSGRLARGASALFTKPNPQMAFGPVQSARVISPTRSALTGVAGVQGIDALMGGSEEQAPAAAPASEGIAALPQAQPAQAPAAETPAAETPAARTMDIPSEADALAAMMPTQTTTPESTPARESAGLGALAQQMARLEAERGDKWGAVSDWMRGVAGAKDNSLGMSLAGGADALRARDKDLEDRLSQLVDTQQKMDLAERAMGVDELRAQTDVSDVELRREMMNLEAQLTEKGYDREDARAAAQNQARVLQAALSQGLSGSDMVRMYTSMMQSIPVGADLAQYSDQVMRRVIEASTLLGGGTGGFNIVEELD